MHTIKNTYNYLRKQAYRIANNIRYKRHIANHIDDDLFRSKLIEYNMQRSYGCDPTICHAPMRSLYFGFGGVVTACCFNRNYILGKFPENTIEEIIHGEKRKLLQQSLDKTDFSLGCQLCKDIIYTGNYTSVDARLADIYPDQGDLPSEMVFELDNSCNLKCEMCSAKFSSAHNNGQRIVKPYDNNVFITQLKPFIPYLTEAKFLGGEPLMSNIYPKIWEAIVELNPKCKIRLQSNGTILNDKIKSLLQHGNFQIGLSIDTLNPEHYKKIRNGAKIETTLGNLEFFNHVCKKNGDYMSISVCPMKENCFDIPELVKFCNNKDICIYFNNVSTAGFSLYELTEQELDELATYYKNNNPQGINHISKNNHIAFSNLIKGVEYIKEHRKQYEFMNELIPCTREEYVKKVLSIISANPEINYDGSIFELIPENFMTKRSNCQYLKADGIKDFFKLPLNVQIETIKEELNDIQSY